MSGEENNKRDRKIKGRGEMDPYFLQTNYGIRLEKHANPSFFLFFFIKKNTELTSDSLNCIKNEIFTHTSSRFHRVRTTTTDLQIKTILY